jgi:hypothetical protein
LVDLWINSQTLLAVSAGEAVTCPSGSPNQPLTWGNVALGARADLLYHQIMLVTHRDLQIVLLISRFGQLATSHIRELAFEGISSPTPSKRALTRLVERKYLARIERRLVGGNGAGSGQYVYQLGSQGWALARREGRYWPYRSVSYHSLAIADAYVALRRRERELLGGIEITGFSTEPDTWQVIAGAELRPDMHIEVAIPGRELGMSFWIEIDMGTERQKQLKDKLARYAFAWGHVDAATMPVFPVVLFIVPDDARLKELNWIIERGDQDAKDLFMVCKTEDFPNFLF